MYFLKITTFLPPNSSHIRKYSRHETFRPQKNFKVILNNVCLCTKFPFIIANIWEWSKMSVVMKSLERLVLAYLKDITRPMLDALQFAYRANRSVDDAVNMGLHYITPRQTWELRKDLICGLHLSLQYHHAWPSLRQSDTALCVQLHLSVDPASWQTGSS